jgi:hypothetical protein
MRVGATHFRHVAFSQDLAMAEFKSGPRPISASAPVADPLVALASVSPRRMQSGENLVDMRTDGSSSRVLF